MKKLRERSAEGGNGDGDEHTASCRSYPFLPGAVARFTARRSINGGAPGQRAASSRRGRRRSRFCRKPPSTSFLSTRNPPLVPPVSHRKYRSGLAVGLLWAARGRQVRKEELGHGQECFFICFPFSIFYFTFQIYI